MIYMWKIKNFCTTYSHVVKSAKPIIWFEIKGYPHNHNAYYYYYYSF
jgi:hypothetical protein